MFVLQNKKKSPWNTCLWFYHELTKHQFFLPTPLFFSLSKKCLRFGDFSFAFFLVFPSNPLTLRLEMWLCRVHHIICCLFLLCLSHSPTLQQGNNQRLPDDSSHVDCFLNTETCMGTTAGSITSWFYTALLWCYRILCPSDMTSRHPQNTHCHIYVYNIYNIYIYVIR